MIIIDEHNRELTYWTAFTTSSSGPDGFYEEKTVARLQKAGIAIEKHCRRTYKIHTKQLEQLRAELIKLHNECQEWSCRSLGLAKISVPYSPINHWAFETERDRSVKDGIHKRVLHSTTKEEPLPEE